ncbi:MAG: methyltransferase [Alphaproteobacteria bacterium]|nr:methyltransferase [Alphaproteobacteria bacterium]
MNAPLDHAEALAAQSGALSAWLHAHRRVWASRPFREQPARWEADVPEVSAWLRALDDDALTALEADPHRADDAPAPWQAWARRARALTEVPDLAGPALEALDDPGLQRRVPARKWAQVRAFAALAAARLPEGEVVDWCAGKGHLGRVLATATGRPARMLERDPDLCAAGQARAAAEGAPCSVRLGDVLDPAIQEELRPGRSAVALHACGTLHETLLREAAARGVDAVAVAPCCYHRRPAGPVPLFSAAGRASGLRLDARQLRLATAEEVVARPHLRAVRRQEMAWRQGLDQLLRHVSGQDRYTTLPSVPRAEVQRPFADFCRWMAAREGIALPAFDAARFEALGWQRARVARLLSLPRTLFRRPLELWLVLDRALAQAEAGRAVAVGVFCRRAVTPRNLVVLSTRRP